MMLSTLSLPTENVSALRPAINHLPNEILEHIIALAFQLAYEDQTSLVAFQFPAHMCRVNRRFYQNTHSVRSIWSHIHLSSTPTPRQLLHIKDRLDAKSRPDLLHLHLDIHPSRAEDDKRVNSLLAAYADSWLSISLEYSIDMRSGSSTWFEARCLAGLSFPRLRHVSVTAPPGMVGGSDFRFRLPDCTIEAPSINIKQCGYPWWLPPPRFSPHLKHLVVEEADKGVVGSYLITALEELQSLESLTLKGIWMTPWLFAREETGEAGIVMESLEYLELSSIPLTTAIRILNFLQTPELKHLALDIVQAITSDAITPEAEQTMMQKFGYCNFPRLNELTLARLPTSSHPDLWIRFLQGMPESAKRLNIGWEANHDHKEFQTIEVLSHPRTITFCWQLEGLSSRGIRRSDLMQVIRGRCLFLKSLEVQFTEPDPEGLIDEFEGLLGTLAGLAEFEVVTCLGGHKASGILL